MTSRAQRYSGWQTASRTWYITVILLPHMPQRSTPDSSALPARAVPLVPLREAFAFIWARFAWYCSTLM